ncbi:MAG: hypothetical protein ABIJ56_13725, partial [Pseudomonadota bacterium]
MKVLIAVGGSGQHAALAVMRMARLGALPEESIKLIVLDADSAQPLSQALLRPWEGVEGAGTHPLGLEAIHAPFDRAASDDATFGSIFMDASHPRERELFEMLFDPVEEKIKIGLGMYGTPCVGSAVFADGAENAAVKSLLAGLGGADEVFFTGSVVGGTGAGILHKLVARVRKDFKGEAFGIFFLPWFSIPSAGGEGAVTPAVINRNLEHGLSYFFDHTVPHLSASVLIGQPAVKTPVVKDLHLRHGDMSEHPHFVHLAAARCMMDLPGAHTANTAVKAYGFGHSETDDGWLLKRKWDGGHTLRIRIDCAVVECALLDHLLEHADSIRKTVKGGMLSFAKPTSITEALYASIVQNAKASKTPTVDFAGDVIAEFGRIRSSLDFCLRW